MEEEIHCKCVRSQCNNGYCKCYQKGLACSKSCSCVNCKNRDTNPVNINDNNDMYSKTFTRALALRKEKKSQIIKRKRELQQQQQIKHSQQQSFDLRVLNMNVRGINNEMKQDQLQKIVEKGKFNILSLTETKLTRKMFINDFRSIQTPQVRHSGVWQGFYKNLRYKLQKTLKSNIAWSSLSIFDVPVHIITCYVPAFQNSYTRQTVFRFKHMIRDIFQKSKHSRIVILGDFNQKLQEIKEFLSDFKIVGVFEEATHDQGNQLDQIFTNMDIIQKQLEQVNFSDHKALTATIRFTKNANDLELSKIPRRYRQTDIKKASLSQQTIQAIKENPETLTKPFFDIIKSQIQERKIIDHWYSAPPKWMIEQQIDDVEIKQTLRNKEWMRLQYDIQQSFKQQQLKRFYYLVKKATKIRKNKAMITGLEVDNEVIYDDQEVQIQAKTFYSKLFDSDSTMADISKVNFIQEKPTFEGEPLFNQEDIEQAINNCNFNKGVGCDGFNGQILSKDLNVRRIFTDFVLDSLNQGIIPRHIREGRMVLLSKESQSCPKIENTRPIVIKSHIFKVFEKAIMRKIQQEDEQFFHFGTYQTGFTKDCNTHQNLQSILAILRDEQRKTINVSSLMFIDIKRAYDSVNQAQLCKIIQDRCDSDKMKRLGYLTQQTVLNNIICYGNQSIQQRKGVVQGSSLSPLLFNIYLDHALKSQQTTRKLIEEGRLYAFADDIAIVTKSQQEIKEIIEAFSMIYNEYQLQLNKDKTIIMTRDNHFESLETFEGIRLVREAKYLGLKLHFKKSDILKEIEATLNAQIQKFKGRVFQQDTQVKNILFMAFIRSLLIYYYTPLRATGMISDSDISKMESRLRRTIFSIPKEIKLKVILNLTTCEEESTVDIIRKLSEKLLQFRNAKLRSEPKQRESSQTYTSNDNHQQRKKLYIDKEILNTMFCVSAGKTLLRYDHCHYCVKHSVIVDRKHMQYCQLLQGPENIFRYNKILEENRFRDLHYNEVKKMMVFFGWIHVRLKSLEESKQYVVIRKNFRVIWQKKKKSCEEAMQITT